MERRMCTSRFMLVTSLAVVALAAGTTTVQADDARDFIAEARLFYRVVACGGTDAVPGTLDAPTVERHCVAMAKRYDDLKKTYADPAAAFFASVRPSGLPTSVVYPFGGGDLVSALVTFPDARDITTISLEHSGDPTRLGGLKKAQLASSLSGFRDAVEGLLSLHDSTSEN